MRRASLLTRFSLLTGTCVALPTLFACLDHPLKPVQYDASQEASEGVAITINKDVDILFVIDNSGSMGEEQENLSRNFADFIGVLEREGVEANYRIGITTTDNGNPVGNCDSPEAGALRLSSCRGRLQEFIFNGTPMVDRQSACTDFCPENLAGLEVTPTATIDDPEEKPRPWLENIGGRSNLPEGVTTTQAFQCFGPQGINGCGFESHLESMYKAILRTEMASEASFGFLRPSAILSVVFVTDEVDCSYNVDWSDIFLPSGNRAFWSDPERGGPTSAVCWNAGVSCEPGDGLNYSSCQSENYDVDGNPGASDGNAVLWPVSRYTSQLQALEDQKRELNPSQEVLVAAISGVPTGYADGTVEIQYRDLPEGTGTQNDPEFQINFGIAPGCTSSVAEAVPPVRLKEFAEAFQVGDDRNLFSVCNESYGPALAAIAEAIEDQIEPACMKACVADTDPVTADVLDPQCILTQEAVGESGMRERTDILPCAADGSLPDGVNVCFQALIDPGGATPDNPNDNMSPECVDQGWNLEFNILRRPGTEPPGGASVSATCQLSEQPAVDCPDLPN